MTKGDYTVNELKEFLRARDLAISGTKSELIARLEEFDCDIWNVIEGEQRQRNEIEAARNQRLSTDDLQERPVIAETVYQNSRENMLQARELELMRRERDLLQRELQFMRQEREAVNSRLTESPARSASATTEGTLSANLSIRAISDLLPEFDGRGGTFWKWQQQIELLRTTYELSEKATRILISSKLKGRAADWLHSKPEHLTITVEDLLQRMKLTFDHRPSQIALRKEFENRVWKSGETFADYCHDKVILGNRVPVQDSEMIEYIIDGVTDSSLRNHARLMRFETTADLLVAFEAITLESKNYGFEKKGVKNYCNNREKPSDFQKKPVRCFNCQENGHISSKCTKPIKRQRGSCFECGSTSHQLPNCPRRLANLRSSGYPRKEVTESTSANIVQSTLPAPYIVPLKFCFVDKNNVSCNYTVNAMFDSGSPISLIKDSCVPIEGRSPLPKDVEPFTGINGSPIEILSLFIKEVEVCDIKIELTIYVVTDRTMSFTALLGRDFARHPLIEICLDENPIVKRKSNEKSGSELALITAVNEILSIDCINNDYKEYEKLEINSEIDSNIKQQITDSYEFDYLNTKNNTTQEIDFEMKIVLKHNQPISFRPRRLSFADKNKLQLLLDNLLERKIIRPSESAYASPIVLVPKKNGEMRLCVDYREINKITIKDNFPSQLIDDNIDQLKNKRYFTSLDLKDGYYNVKVAEDSVKYTSFVTPLGQFEFLYCPFGLTNAPKVFHRFVRKIFSNLIKDNKMLPFFDDFFIATENMHEHLVILKQVLKLAGQYRLTFRLDKCFFMQTEIDYLGYHVNLHGIRPSDDNIEAVINFPIPQNAKHVLRFVSLASYFRRFISGFAVIAKPLYNLVKQNAKFIFGEKELEAFEILKKHLANKPILAIYSPLAETELHCDASASGFGAILLQKQNDGNLKPIFYFSQRTTQTESKYHSFELECLAVVNAIKRFKIYLGGIHFKIITDCDSFRLTLSKQTVNPRIARWAMFLQDFDYEIQHRPGRRMSHVDALSRCHGVLVIEGNTFDQTLSICQDRDEEIGKIREQLEKTELKHFELRDGLVYRKNKLKKLLFYVPQSMENNVIRTCHDNLGHLGFDKVIENILKIYWFPEMRSKVKQYISNCLKCIEFSPHSGKLEGYLHNIEKEKLPFITIHIDHLGPLEKTGKGFKHILAIVDAFTKFIKLFACKTTNSVESIEHLKSYFRAYSKPQRIITDRGTSFTSNTFKEFLETEKVEHVLIAVGTPRANGQIERFNRVITPMIAKLCSNTSKWDTVLGKVEFALNNTVCRSTKETPSRLLFGTDQCGETNDCLRRILEANLDEERDLEKIREEAAKNIQKMQAINKKYFDSKRKEAFAYNVGDYVMIKNVDTTVGVNKKLLPKYKGPYVVKKVLDCDRYVISDIDGFQITQIPYNGVVAPDNIKPYIALS